MKRDFLDKAISDAVRASWAMCAKCFRPFERQANGSWSKNFQCSHYYRRGSGNSTRWYPDNLTALCGTCHDALGTDHEAHYKFFKSLLGEGCYAALKLRKHAVMKYTRDDKREMAAYYRTETVRIMAQRDAGEIGYIPVIPWD